MPPEDQTPQLTPTLAWFARRHLRSLEDVDILLLLWSAQEQWWTAAEVAESVRTTATIAADSLQRLSPALLECRTESGTRYRFRNTDPQAVGSIAALARLYGEHRHELVRFIASQSAAAVRDFAEAFKLKRDQ